MLSEITIQNYRKENLEQIKKQIANKNPYWYYCISKNDGGYKLDIMINDRTDNSRDVDKFIDRKTND